MYIWPDDCFAGILPACKKSTSRKILISKMSNFTGISFWGLGTTRGVPKTPRTSHLAQTILAPCVPLSVYQCSST